MFMKRLAVKLFGLSLVCLFANEARPQTCDAILNGGLRNITIMKSAEAATATKYFNHCFKDFSTMSDDILASIEVQVFGYGGGDGSFSRARREQRLIEWCQQSKETANSHKDEYLETQTIYGDSVAAWARCKQLQSADVQIEPTISPDAKSVDFRLRYTGPSVSGVQFVGVNREGFKCDIRIATSEGIKDFDPAKPVFIDRQSINVSCRRDPAAQIVRDNTTYSVVERGVISILTGGSNLQLFFAEEYDPSLPVQAAAQMKSQIEKLQADLAALRNSPIATSPDGKVDIGEGPAMLAGYKYRLRVLGSHNGIVGETNHQGGGIGIWGRSTASEGSGYGVQGDTSSPGGGGVVGINYATSGSGFGLAGEVRSPSGTALRLLSASDGDLIQAKNKYGTMVFQVTSDGTVRVNGREVQLFFKK